MTEWEQAELSREFAASRRLKIELADDLVFAARALLGFGQRHHRPRLAYRAGRLLIKAADFYARAELGRKAEAIGRLLERCRRAWIRWEESEGFK